MQMMSLHMCDRAYPAELPPHLRVSPLLSCEALRRLAWATFYADAMVDGGRYGFHIVDEKTFRLQLPCDETSFLSNEAVVTKPLFVDPANPTRTIAANPEGTPLDMSAYLLQTAAARRRGLHLAFRVSHGELTGEQSVTELAELEAHVDQVVGTLPKRFHFSTENMLLHQDRSITFLLLHILRHNLYIIIGRAALQIYQREPTKANLIPQVRQKRIAHALPIAGLVSEGLRAGINFDPHIGVQAYVALESMHLASPPSSSCACGGIH